MRNIDEIINNQLPVVFLGSSTGMYNQIDICRARNRQVLGIVDDDYSSHSELHGLPILKEIPNNCEFFIATFWTPFDGPVFKRNREKRERLLDFAKNNQLPMATLVHPTAVVSSGAQIGRNVSIGAQSYISHGVHIKSNVLIREQVFIGHDVTIAENTALQIKATITGETDISDNVYVGINSTIVNRFPLKRITIGANSLIYPNELVLTSVPKNKIVKSRRLRT
jgi:acyl-[acyl carrier protein]--UDP-N-acetylglucosamine O-acyltransferase